AEDGIRDFHVTGVQTCALPIWPESLAWQQWSNPILMFLYGTSGLAFASRFLDLRVMFPRARKAVIGFCATFGALLVAAFLLDSQDRKSVGRERVEARVGGGKGQ